MNVDNNIQSMQVIGQSQEISAHNIANVNTDGYEVAKPVQPADRISISSEARAAEQSANSLASSNTDVGKEFVKMSVNETGYTANVKAIQTQSDMEKSLFELKE